jgi:hypothetical protein
MMPPSAAIASMFSPARVEPTLTDAHTRLVAASACGMAAKRLASIVVIPFSTCAEKPPRKSTSTSCAARSSVCASCSKSSGRERPAISDTGVTAMRLLMIGSPNSSEISALTRRRLRAVRSILSYTLRQSASGFSLTQSSRLMPTVMVRISSCSVRTMVMVSRISSPEKLRCRMAVGPWRRRLLRACRGRTHRRYTRCMALKISSR